MTAPARSLAETAWIPGIPAVLAEVFRENRLQAIELYM
jgi:hypothetical protein